MSNVANRIVSFVQEHQNDQPRAMYVQLSIGEKIRFDSVLEYGADFVLVLKLQNHTHFIDANSIVDFIVYD
ncbi:hypothetical protein ACOV5J_05655 [Weissella soli]|uniref:hypothetical protein n=1 Tax=Weissella soli TaxID=155866 RepID=UPI003C795F4A